MQLKTSMRLNARSTVEMTVDAKDLEEAIQMSAPLLDFNGTCGMCGDDNVTLKVRKSKDGKFTYTNYTCLACGGTLPFGKLQLGGYFLKQWQPKYEGTDNPNG